MGFKRSPLTEGAVAARQARDDELAALRKALVKKGVITDQDVEREKPVKIK